MSDLNAPACSASNPMGRADVSRGAVWDKIHAVQKSAISRQAYRALCKNLNAKSVSVQLNPINGCRTRML